MDAVDLAVEGKIEDGYSVLLALLQRAEESAARRVEWGWS
jgi:hypothetical protein